MSANPTRPNHLVTLGVILVVLAAFMPWFTIRGAEYIGLTGTALPGQDSPGFHRGVITMVGAVLAGFLAWVYTGDGLKTLIPAPLAVVPVLMFLDTFGKYSNPKVGLYLTLLGGLILCAGVAVEVNTTRKAEPQFGP